MHNTSHATLTTISPSMATLGADMRRDTVRLGAIFPLAPPSAPPLPLCFISTELPSTAPADFRQAQQFPIFAWNKLELVCRGGALSLLLVPAMLYRYRHRRRAGAPCVVPRHGAFDLRSFLPTSCSNVRTNVTFERRKRRGRRARPSTLARRARARRERAELIFPTEGTNKQ